MAFSGEKILIVSPESWGKSMLSKHHYAVTLAEMGNDVWFLLPPWADRTLAETHRHPKVHLVFDAFTVKGARFLPKALRKWLYGKLVAQLQQHCGVEFTLVWSFDNSRFFDLDCFKRAYRIHHMMDFHTDYQNEIASSSADLCLGVTSGIVDKMLPFNPHSYFVQHGYAPVAPQAASLPAVPQTIKALYTGNLLMPYINWPWLHALVTAFPQVHFFMAGSYGKGNLNEHPNPSALAEIEKLASHAHVTLLGECLPGAMQSYFEQVDLLFFAYRSQEFPEILANSHKIMAYLASGKPVVCHTILEYQNHHDLLYMADSAQHYIAQFKEVVEHLSEHSNPTVAKKRMQWAEQNTYAKQIERVYALTQQTDRGRSHFTQKNKA